MQLAINNRSELFTKLSQLTIITTAFVMPISVSLTDIFYVLSLVFVLLSGQMRQKLHLLLKNPVAISFFVFMALFFLGLIYTDASEHNAFKDIYKHHWILFTPFLMLIFDNPKIRKYTINAFLIAMTITLILSYFRWLGDLGSFFGLYLKHTDKHTTNVFFNHIVQNVFLSFAAGIIAYRFFYYGTRRWLYGTLFILISFNVLFLSHGRTGYISYIVILTYVSLFRFGWKGFFASLGLLAALFLLAYHFSTPFQSRILRTVHNLQRFEHNQTRTSFGYKLAMTQNSIKLFKKSPLLGYGSGGIKAAYRTLPKTDINRTGLVGYVEIGYLNILLEFGIIGFIIFLGILAIQCRYSFRLSHENKFIMQSFLAVYLVGSIGNPFFLSYSEVHLYSLIAAAIFSSLLFAKSLQKNPSMVASQKNMSTVQDPAV